MKIFAAIFCVLLLLFLLAPVLVLIPMSLGSAKMAEFPPRTLSLDQYRVFFHSRPWIQSVLTSFRIGLATMIFQDRSLASLPYAASGGASIHASGPANTELP